MLTYFLRHGQTDWNKEGRWQSTNDIPLNDTGRAQAARVRLCMGCLAVEPTQVVTSPLSRATETAQIVFAQQAVPIIVEPAFSEISLGDFEGRYQADLRAELGGAYDDWLATNHTEPAPNGEPFVDAVQRVREPLANWVQQAGDGPLVIVAHQAIIMAMKVALSGDDSASALKRYKQSNTDIDIWDHDSQTLVRRIDSSEAEVCGGA